MKKLIITVIIFLSSLQVVYSQSGWFWQNPKITHHDIKDIQFVNANIVYACGNYGTFIKSTDGGKNWDSYNFLSNISRYPPSGLLSISFANVSTGCVLSYGGELYRTTNAGDSWTKINIILDDYTFGELVLRSNGSGILVQNGIYRTTNFGQNWILSYMNDTAHFCTLSSVDDNISYVLPLESIPRGFFLKTIDAGINWTVYPLVLPQYFRTNAIDFINSNTGYILASKATQTIVLKTTDGGNKWKKFYICDDYFVPTLKFINENTGIVTGLWGNIYRTTNNGEYWNRILIDNNTSWFRSIGISPDNSVLLAGSGGMMYKSTDFGNIWFNFPENITSENLYDLSFINYSTGLIVGDNGVILKTTDKGSSWMKTILSGNPKLNKVKLFSSGIGYVSGETSNFYKTTNFGDNWIFNNLSSYGQSFYLSGISEDSIVLSQATVTEISNQKSIYSSDGGYTWKVDSNCNNYNIAITFDKRLKRTLTFHPYVGFHESVFHTTNQGTNWEEVVSTYVNEMGNFSIGYSGTKFVFISGGYNRRIRTNNFFQTIQNLGQGNNYGTSIGKLNFKDSINGIGVGGGYSAIIRTSNSGYNWFIESNITSWVNALQFIDEETAVGIGPYGAIFRTDSIDHVLLGIMKIQERTPNNYLLDQNYPNPFNPTTKIKFDLPKSTHAKLIIYDILGREVAVLVNEKLGAGRYEVSWSAGSYPSGVYFYKLTTKDFSKTKRMVLVK